MKRFNEISKEDLFDIVNTSKSLSDVLRKLNRPTNHGNFRTLKKYCSLYHINLNDIMNNTEKYGSVDNECGKLYELSEILVSGSTYGNITRLKKRLFKAGLKTPICEKCGQDEWWNGEKISLILDHVNGVHSDHRIENLRMVCPNCNATLPTNGGKNILYKKNKTIVTSITKPKKEIIKINGVPERLLNARKMVRIVERPQYDILLNNIFDLGYCGTGRKYEVSDNTIRKWKKYYEKYE